MSPRMRTRVLRMEQWTDGFNHRLERRVREISGFKLILFFWGLYLLMISGCVLLLEGLALWNPWVFLAGMMSLQLLIFFVRLGRRHLRMFDR